MSLFGGDDIDAPSQDVSMHDASASDAGSSLSSTSEQDFAGQSYARQEAQEEHGDDISDYETESDAEYRGRPNAYKGHAETWQRYTAQDRAIYSGLQFVRADDLSAHLYNAFALTYRFRNGEDFSESLTNLRHKSLWIAAEQRKQWTPPKWWTQWPLPPDCVPSAKEVYGRGGGRTEKFNRTSPHEQRNLAYGDLIEIMLGHLLRMSREIWTNRVWDVDETEHRAPKKRKTLSDKASRLKISSSGAEDEYHSASTSSEGSKNRLDQESDSSSDSASSYFAPPRPQSQAIERDPFGSSSSEDEPHDVQPVDSMDSANESGFRAKSTRTRSRSATTRRSARSDTEFMSTTPSGSRTGTPVPPHFSKPEIMADEEKARQILQPSINSLISNLDRLLWGLDLSYHTKTQSARRTGASEQPLFEDQYQLDPDLTSAPDPKASSSKTPRKRGRPPKMKPIPDPAASPKRGGGRPSKYPKPLPGESYYMMKKRVHRERAQIRSDIIGEPTSSRPASPSNTVPNRQAQEAPQPIPMPDPQNPSPSRPTSPHSSEPPSPSSKNHPKTRDWSEVLGVASLCGWNEAVVARAAARCASLFGESMAFRTLHENTKMGDTEEPFQYHADIIPAFGELESSSDEATTSKGHKMRRKSNTTVRPRLDPHSPFCPHEECYAHTRGFRNHYGVIEHLMKVHAYDPREDADVQSSEVEGGVHVDGYMKPVWKHNDEKARPNKTTPKKEPVRSGTTG
ncbi:hypothetical protein EJ05DRAFT_118767 [Pseudovirgaria hyperparasitica]|uniref:Rrn9 domain-containing protein n=1 Tax=Pseudovirgaria hyperparasitica TaxID=470096 RepID=A0A6A6W1T5_9PEZI|nr:uncharacterized protein EJ05DRAFT_118767 [Pseudovirgaria hyperparasitica]KAF2755001.1 hypothetical protein EJ05DRAFT_118767 [Pseudovirgaria hyperparasitica]